MTTPKKTRDYAKAERVVRDHIRRTYLKVEDVDDVVQEAMARTSFSFREDGGASLPTFACRIVDNVVREQRRASARERGLVAAGAEHSEIAAEPTARGRLGEALVEIARQFETAAEETPDDAAIGEAARRLRQISDAFPSPTALRLLGPKVPATGKPTPKKTAAWMADAIHRWLEGDLQHLAFDDVIGAIADGVFVTMRRRAPQAPASLPDVYDQTTSAIKAAWQKLQHRHAMNRPVPISQLVAHAFIAGGAAPSDADDWTSSLRKRESRKRRNKRRVS